MQPIKNYFEEALKSGASDLHLVGGDKPVLRIDGNLKNIEDEPIFSEELEKAIYTLLDSDRKKAFEENLELDFGLEIGETRFRVNLHRQNGTIGLAARVIPKDIPTPQDLRFEPQLLEATNYMDGLILIVGPTGHGKSTTLATMINEINKNRKSHIITIEDPIEFVFKEDKSLIEQREVGIDTKSFSEALKHVLRQDPNVILIGEMRDLETISIALTAAETGHLVLSTLHASSAAEAIERISATVPDVALIKLGLMDISGDIVIGKLKRMAKTQDVKFILYTEQTADKTVITERISQKEGVDRFVTYSDAKQLVDTVNELLKI